MHSSSRPADLLHQMAAEARARYGTDANWAEAAGMPKETLSRLKSSASCDLRTIAALADAVEYRLVAVSVRATGDARERFDREREGALMALVVSGNVQPEVWRAHGSGFFMGGLAVMLASSRGFDRERYLRLGEALHPGISTPEVFARWLEESPVRPSRFLPMARKQRSIA